MLPAHEEILSIQLVRNNKYARQVRSCAAGLTENIVECYLNKIPTNKATGLDGISVRILKEALPAISASLTHVYNTIVLMRVLFLMHLS
jgi:hypothetical protein